MTRLLHMAPLSLLLLVPGVCYFCRTDKTFADVI